MKYSAIAEVSGRLVGLLRDQMVPEVISEADRIGLCSPADKGDMALGIYLYDIRESDEFRTASMVTMDAFRQKFPSSFLNLFYIVTAYSNSDIKYRAEEEQEILGKVIQVFADYASLDDLVQGTGVPEWEVVPTIVMNNLSLEDKMRIWNFPNVAYKTSLFYRVGPVEVEAARTRTVQRVTSVDFGMKQKQAEGTGGNTNAG